MKGRGVKGEGGERVAGSRRGLIMVLRDRKAFSERWRISAKGNFLA